MLSKLASAYAIPVFAEVAFLYRLASAHQAMPGRIATHFTLSGEPNGWMSKGSFTVFSVVLLSALIAGGITLVQNASIPQTTGWMLYFGATIGLVAGSFWSVVNVATGARFSFLPSVIGMVLIGGVTAVVAHLTLG